MHPSAAIDPSVPVDPTTVDESLPVDGGSPADEAGPADVEVGPDGTALRARGATYERVVVAILCLVGVQIGSRPLNDNSFLTHLATGRLILDEGGIPRADPYSFSAHGEPWTVQSWLASVIYAGIERAGGLVSLRLLTVVLTVALLQLVWRLTRPAETLLGRVLPTIAVIAIGNTYWSERPLLFGLVGLALVLLVAEDGLHPAWLLPVMWIWVNTHGSFPFAGAVLVLLAIGRRLDGERPDVELRALAWCVGGIALAAVNPLGPRLLVFPLSVLDKREAFASVVEWQAPSWTLLAQRAFAILAIGALAAVLLRRRRWRSILPIVAFSAAGAMSMRNLSQAAIVVVCAVAPAFAGLGRVRAEDRRAINGPAALAFSVLAVVFLVTSLTRPHTDLDAYPTEVAAWLEEQQLLGPDTRVLAADFVGNYLEARFGPDEVQVYIDDRVDMYPLSVIHDYQALRDDDREAGIPAVVERIDPTVIVWESDTVLGRWLDADPEGWTVVHRTDDWLVATSS